MRSFLERGPRRVWPERADLGALEDEQRRVTGGLLHRFLGWLQSGRAEADHPILSAYPLEQRVFVFITDASGVVAARDMMDLASPMAVCVFKDAWQRYLESAETEDDDAMEHHYQMWSAWHRNVPASWDVALEPGLTYWVHEEGWALAERLGRGAQHLWSWDGAALTLVRQDLTSWTSAV